MAFAGQRYLKSGLRIVVLVAGCAGLGACAGFGFGENPPPQPQPVYVPPPVVAPAPKPAPAPLASRDPSLFYTPKEMAGRPLIRVALLLPFNSARPEVRALSNSLYNAAQLALFEFNNPNIILMPKATGSATMAQAAAEDAIRKGADLIVGPLFAEEVSAVAPIAHAANVPVVAFSSDTTVAGNGVYLLSFPPTEDVKRIIDFASTKGFNNYAALFPQDDYGTRVRVAFEQAVADHGGHIATIETYGTSAENMNLPVQRLANYGARHGALLAKKAALKKANDTAGLKALDRVDTIGDVNFQAVFVPEGGARLRALAPLLPYYDVDPRKVKFLGTGLWDDPTLAREPALDGGWFPAPPPEAHQQFVARYQRVYGGEPPRIASLAYDAVSLAVALSSKPEGQRFTPEALMTPDGFAGVDGIFRFLGDGHTERGLAVLEMHPSGAVVIDPAPTSFAVPPSL